MADIGYGAIGRPRDRGWAIAVYALYLVGPGAALLLLAGAAAAFVRRTSAGPVWRSHFRFQVRGMALMAVATLALAAFFVIGDRGILGVLGGAMAAVALLVWWIARNLTGLLKAIDDAPVRNPNSLMFGA
jgi:uncharacterized membrane protein